MNSEMRSIVEYWCRDHEVALDWQRDPTFEGPVRKKRLDPPDTVAEMLAGIAGGAKTIRVDCTSEQNRYALAGRVAAAMMGRGRMLVAYPDNYLVVARKMLDGLIPDEDVGSWRKTRGVTLISFGRLDVTLAEIEWCIILAAPPNAVTQEVRKDAATRFAEAVGRVRVEFVLTHSLPILDSPDVVIDAGRVERRQE